MRSLGGSALVLALLVSLLSTVGPTEQGSAAEPDGIGAAEGSQLPTQPISTDTISTDTICSALAAAAAQNDLPTDFFARLIWQESRFDPAAASILSGRQTYVVHHGLGQGTMGWAHVRVGADDRASAQKLCVDLLSAGVSWCEVQRTRSAR